MKLLILIIFFIPLIAYTQEKDSMSACLDLCAQTISKSQLKNSESICINTCNLNYEIVKYEYYEVLIAFPRRDLLILKGNTNYLKPNIINEFKNVEVGTTIAIANIRVLTTSGKRIRLADSSFIVVE